jgi:hypothetical protein
MNFAISTFEIVLLPSASSFWNSSCSFMSLFDIHKPIVQQSELETNFVLKGTIVSFSHVTD